MTLVTSTSASRTAPRGASTNRVWISPHDSAWREVADVQLLAPLHPIVQHTFGLPSVARLGHGALVLGAEAVLQLPPPVRLHGDEGDGRHHDHDHHDRDHQGCRTHCSSSWSRVPRIREYIL